MTERPQPIHAEGFAAFLARMAEEVRTGQVLVLGFDQQPLPGQLNLMSVRYVRLAEPADGEAVWFVGCGDDVVGVFTSEEAADRACATPRHYLARVPLDRPLQHGSLGERYPRQEAAS